jgi:RimJ/RimL family protein N-acetyltransferase
MTGYWEGRSILLRGLESRDIEHFLRWNRDSERARNLDFLWPPVGRDQVAVWVEEQSHKKLDGDQYHWIIENRGGQAVGSIATHHCNHRNGTFSYAVDIDSEHRRQGYATEAITMVLGYYFRELRYQKVTVPVHCNNNPSLQLHDSLGFRREGLHRRMVFSQGDYIDIVWFGMTDDEFYSRFGRA